MFVCFNVEGCADGKNLIKILTYRPDLVTYEMFNLCTDKTLEINALMWGGVHGGTVPSTTPPPSSGYDDNDNDDRLSVAYNII